MHVTNSVTSKVFLPNSFLLRNANITYSMPKGSTKNKLQSSPTHVLLFCLIVQYLLSNFLFFDFLYQLMMISKVVSLFPCLQFALGLPNVKVYHLQEKATHTHTHGHARAHTCTHIQFMLIYIYIYIQLSLYHAANSKCQEM